ncbi:MAG: hypothetical protein ACP5FK_01100 [bacterium]
MKFRWGLIVGLSFCGLLYSNQVESLLTNCPQYNFEQYRVIPLYTGSNGFTGNGE